ncbi:TATA element modulatory factor 1 TATA binding-domain-containing protein [Chaetomium tenue]|uniref:TATA element modulatory factor 1 TATA binding-domain-containing protein n=1 Tax=Chaetomium tenue TaxID=1854479 RepID=A0ACB7P465_9PEZI|nr:TATA element modulatory factor 1 TATA binding-domain-containing protein [Chaetomium globosum]
MSARWGSFLSQAVAGVEARLDNILAEDENGAAQQETKPATPVSPAKQSPGPSRAASSTRTNDRLQERLARAMAAKAAARNSISSQGSPRQSLDVPARNSTDSVDRSSPTLNEFAKETPSPRGSQDIPRNSLDAGSPKKAERDDSVDGGSRARESGDEANGARNSADIQPSITSSPTTIPIIVPPDPEPQDGAKTGSDDAGDDAGDEEQRENGDKADDAQLQHQQEIHEYVERIDALEAKLQFLAKEATDVARKAVLAAPAGSAEKKLAEKDQQIVQLMEEGKNLASTDHKHRALVKKLRMDAAKNEKELETARIARAKSDKEIEDLRSRVRRTQELEKAHEDLQRRLDQTQKEVSTLRPEIRSKDSTIAELRSRLQKANEQADAMTIKANEQAREQDKRRIADLEEEVAALKVEKTLVADRGKAQATELREKAERASERARVLELELKAEMQVMEGKLEAMRTRAEEASSGVAGDSQAKLLRQVETLQTQYSIASENWQGIETTLLARITGLEKERDEALQRESDMRRKAREAAVRARRQEEELDEAKTKIPTIQEDVKSYQSQLDSLKKRAEEAESALANTRAEFEKQKQAWEAEKEERQLRDVPERPRSWLEGLPGGSFLKPDSRPASPQLTNPQRTFSTDFLGITTLASKGRKTPGTSDAGGGGGALAEPRMPFSRRPSAQHPPSRPTINSNPSGGGSNGVFSPLGVFSPTSEAPAPSLSAPHQHQHPLDMMEVQRGEDAFEGGASTSRASRGRHLHGHGHNGERSASPQQVLQDMVSVSTVAAGPSVQLVERMSAAIRRLESEKVAGREELARISRQRDDARAELVALMREAEGGRAAGKRVEVLEGEVAVMKERYETTLELLGEKSELVEELRADVEDVKAMYRDLVERTIK